MTEDQMIIENAVATLTKICGQFRSLKYALLICKRPHGHLGMCRLDAGPGKCAYEWWGFPETAPKGTENHVWLIEGDHRKLLAEGVTDGWVHE
jgi:hypothetical protein